MRPPTSRPPETPTASPCTWDAVTGATGYKVFRRVGADAFAQIATTVSASYDDTGVVADTTYDYIVRATDGDNEGLDSVIASASLSAQAPAQVTNLTATGDADSIALSWDAVTDATGYKVFRRVGADAFAEIATTTTTSYDDTGVVAGTTYDYIVRATAGDNEGLDSAIASASLQTVAPEEPTAPAPVTDLAAALSADGESVVLTWTGSADDVDRYAVDRETLDSDPAENVTVGVVDADTTTITDDDITAGKTAKTYRYSVIAIAFGEDVTFSEEVTVDVEIPAAKPAPVTNLVAALSADGESVVLTWTGSAGDVDRYAVDRETLDSDPAEIVTVGVVDADTTTITDDDITAGKTDKTYRYSVIAIAVGEDATFSEEVTVDVEIPAAEPAPVTDLVAAISADGESVVLTWTGSADDVDRYAVDRETLDSDPAEIVTVGVVDAETTTITDDDIAAGQTYRYSVIAIAGGEDGAFSEEVTVDVEIPAADPSGPLTVFTLVDTSAPSTHTVLSDDDVVELADPDNGSYGIYITTVEDVGSVGLSLVGPKTVSRTENLAPYSLYGDGGSDQIHGESLPVGEYTITATAYSEADLGGDELGILEVSFTVSTGN